jgi:inner membrane protein
MASFLGHFAAGYTITKVLDWKSKTGLILLALGSSWLPDIDILCHMNGVPYDHMFGHRGFTHSIFFAALWASIVMIIFKVGVRKIVWLTIFLSTLSHGILDAMTTGGRGIAFFAPFSAERYFLPWRGIKVSPMSASRFFSDWGLKVLMSELILVVIPCALILLLTYVYKRVVSRRSA